MNNTQRTTKKQQYSFNATVFGARNTVTDKKALDDAEQISIYLAKKDITLVNGASKDGIMGFTAKCAFENGGTTYGIGLQKYEPHPHKFLTQWEGYDTHQERQERLIEMGDFYIALNGGLGTIHEIIEVHIKQFLGETTKPLILIGQIGDLYKELCDKIKTQGLYHKLSEEVFFAKDADEAIAYIENYLQKCEETQYVSDIYYPALTPEKIYTHINKNKNAHFILFEQMKMKVSPNIYPSNRFRSSLILGEEVKNHCANKIVADIACGHGTMGLVAAKNGATQVVQTDINPDAVENAIENALTLGFENIVETYQGSTVTAIPHTFKNKCDVVLFNPPFHKQKMKTEEKELMYAFVTDGFTVLDEFFANVKQFLTPNGYVLLGFSNKDHEALAHLQELIAQNGFEIEQLDVHNKKTVADNRIYKLVQIN